MIAVLMGDQQRVDIVDIVEQFDLAALIGLRGFGQLPRIAVTGEVGRDHGEAVGQLLHKRNQIGR